MSKAILRTLTLVAVAGAGAGTYVKYFTPHPVPKVSEATITSGSVIELVKATGTLTPMRSVDVGTQVSGTVRKLYVDFDSIVRKGQLVAELDPAALQAALESARATADQTQIALDQDEQVVDNDRHNLARTSALFAGGIATRQELDDAKVAVDQDDAQIVQDQATVTSARSGVKAAEINLAYCEIYSPVDGVVIARNVDEGQTVSARMETPSLYVIATDLTSLQLIGDVDESYVGRLRPGQHASFTVDAYPAIRFDATVTEVRLNATMINNVVTYQAIIAAPNPELRLLPGMTANLTIETASAAQAVRVPNRALRFEPTAAMLTAFGQTSPAATSAPPVAIPDKVDPPTSRPRSQGASIDDYFEPLPSTERPGQVWVLDHQRLVRVPIELGITDGTWTQVLSGDVEPGEAIIGSILVPPATKAPR